MDSRTPRVLIAFPMTTRASNCRWSAAFHTYNIKRSTTTLYSIIGPRCQFHLPFLTFSHPITNSDSTSRAVCMSLANSTPPTRTSSTRLRKPSPGPLTYPANSSSRPRPHHHHLYSLHWLFRSNIPRRRRSLLPVDVHKRNFFGMGEILGVLTNVSLIPATLPRGSATLFTHSLLSPKPAETVRSLTESRRLLDEARREINEGRERSQIPTKHTFSRLPGYFPRVAEAHALEHVLQGDPSFTVLFGASSVGKVHVIPRSFS
jgi:hypothetical protein